MNSDAKIKYHRREELLNFSRKKRLPIILQSAIAECGLACLAMICGYHGFETDIISLRRKFSISAKGTSLKSIMDMSTRMHLTPRALRIEIDQLKHIQLPCILHWAVSSNKCNFILQRADSLAAP